MASVHQRMWPRRAAPALAPLLLMLSVLVLAMPGGALARSLLAKDVGIAMPIAITTKLLDTYLKGANASAFSSLWSSPNVSPTLRQVHFSCSTLIACELESTMLVRGKACMRARRLGAPVSSAAHFVGYLLQGRQDAGVPRHPAILGRVSAVYCGANYGDGSGGWFLHSSKQEHILLDCQGTFLIACIVRGMRV